MKKAVFAALVTSLLTGCAGVNTGRKSVCFGHSGSDGNYIDTSVTNPTEVVSSKGTGSLSDGCDFETL